MNNSIIPLSLNKDIIRRLYKKNNFRSLRDYKSSQFKHIEYTKNLKDITLTKYHNSFFYIKKLNKSLYELKVYLGNYNFFISTVYSIKVKIDTYEKLFNTIKTIVPNLKSVKKI